MKGAPAPHYQKIIMSIVYLSITDASVKYKRKRTTLMSWVKKNKVISKMIPQGDRQVHVIDEESLKIHLAKYPSSETPVETIPSNGESHLPPREDQMSPEIENSAHPLVTNEESEKDFEQKAKRKRTNPVQSVKNSMRSLSVPELCRVNAWVGTRILEKMNPSTHPR